MLKPETIDLQNKLAKYVRTGEETQIEGAVQGRLHHYRRLVFNVIHNTLSQAYPIAKEILGNEKWDNLVNEFFINHDPQEAQIWRMPFELYEYIDKVNYSEKIGIEYLDQLVYFEWLEIELFGMKDEVIPEFTDQGDILNDELVLNPYLIITHLQYPFHKNNHEELIENKGDYFIITYRDIKTDKVNFFEISPLFAVILEELIENKIALDSIVFTIDKLKVNDFNTIKQHTITFLNDILLRGIILGFKS